MNKIKILVVGCGSIGLRHLQNLQLRRDVEIAAFDPRSEAAQNIAEIGADIKFFQVKDTAAIWQPELVIVATPNHLHREWALWAFSNNAHVLCEKPLADTVESGKIIVEAAAKSGKILAVGFTERYREAIRYIIEEARAGKMGTLVGGRAMVGTYNTLLCAKQPELRANTFGSVIVDYVHELDILAEIFGEMKKLECFANNLAIKERKSLPSLAAMIIEYQSGAVVSVHFDYVQHPQRRFTEIYGDKKTFCYDFGSDQLQVYACDQPGFNTRTFNNVRNEQFEREHSDIIKAIRTGTHPLVSGKDALRSLIVAEEAIKRLRNNLPSNASTHE